MSAKLDQIGARFQFYMKIKELGIYEIGVLTGTSAVLISNIASGKNYTMDELLKVLSELKDLNAHWVIYGEGNIFKKSTHNGPIAPEKRLLHLQEMQSLLARLDNIEKSKHNKSQIDDLKAKIAALTTKL